MPRNAKQEKVLQNLNLGNKRKRGRIDLIKTKRIIVKRMMVMMNMKKRMMKLMRVVMIRMMMIGVMMVIMK